MSDREHGRRTVLGTLVALALAAMTGSAAAPETDGVPPTGRLLAGAAGGRRNGPAPVPPSRTDPTPHSRPSIGSWTTSSS